MAALRAHAAGTLASPRGSTVSARARSAAPPVSAGGGGTSVPTRKAAAATPLAAARPLRPSPPSRRGRRLAAAPVDGAEPAGAEEGAAPKVTFSPPEGSRSPPSAQDASQLSSASRMAAELLSLGDIFGAGGASKQMPNAADFKEGGRSPRSPEEVAAAQAAAAEALKVNLTNQIPNG